MTLDEAIKHCLDIADAQDKCAEISVSEHAKERISKCAADHRQLAEWLGELKELRHLVDLVAKYAGNSEDVCERYLPSINGDLCVTDGMGASNCTCCGYEYRCDYKTDIWLLEDVETSTNADVQPVKRGFWKALMMSEETGWDLSLTGGHDTVCEYVCSVCGKPNIVDEFGDSYLPNFCPNCGARMIKDGDVE